MEMPETAGVLAAKKMQARLAGEAEAIAELKKAIKSNKPALILTALNACNELGITGAEIEKGKEALSKLGAQSEALLRLSEALKAADIEAIDKELEVLDKFGLGDEPEVKKAREDTKKIAKQNKLADKLAAATKERKKDTLLVLLSEAEDLNLRVRFEDAVKAAQRVVDIMNIEENLSKALQKCVLADDEDALNDTAEKAQSMGGSDEITAKIEAAREDLAKRRVFIRKLTDAMDADPVDKDLLVRGRRRSPPRRPCPFFLSRARLPPPSPRRAAQCPSLPAGRADRGGHGAGHQGLQDRHGRGGAEPRQGAEGGPQGAQARDEGHRRKGAGRGH